mmetsp:Transcript_11082/g.21721  ORF Transcript_11082/g.21721 Transcript_11082/m.21721 type:complete len:466 (+) Transcript_11082:372-1769(+)
MRERPKTQQMSNHKLEQARLSEKLTFEPSKLGFEGVKCYDVLHALLQKDPSLNIRVPLTLILNCGSNYPRLLYYKNDRLKCKDLRIHMRQVRRMFERLISEAVEKVSLPLVVPIAVTRYVNKFTKFFMENVEIERHWPNSDTDAILQEFITPKGIVVTKTRVVVKPDSTRVFVISNKARVDGIEENELIKHREESKHVRQLQQQDDALYKEIQPTLLKRRQIMHKLRNSEDMTHSSFVKSSPGLVKAYDLFRFDYTCTDMKITEPKKRPLIQRFSAHCDSTTSNIYEVSVIKYTEIISIAERLRDKLNEHILIREQVRSIVIDFMQGADGKWYFINLKYLGIVDRRRTRVSMNFAKAMPLVIDCNGDYCKMSRTFLKDSMQHLLCKHDIAALLRNRSLSGGKILRSEIHRHRAALKLKSAYNCSYKLMSEQVSICSLCAKFYQDVEFLKNYRKSVGAKLDVTVPL